MKKINAFLMGLILIAALTACSSNEQPQISEAPDTAQEASINSEGSTPEAEETEAAGGKTLVVYYSATGSTEAVANIIASETNADIFKLEPSEPYSNEDLNWRDSSSRVVYEHDNPAVRDVPLIVTEAPDWEAYDTVYIGYPIWWGIAAWPMNGFIETNDFTGKTVVPFCTSTSSDLGESVQLLEELAGSGNWLEGERFSSDTSDEIVSAWIDSLGL